MSQAHIKNKDKFKTDNWKGSRTQSGCGVRGLVSGDMKLVGLEACTHQNVCKHCKHPNNPLAV